MRVKEEDKTVGKRITYQLYVRMEKTELPQWPKERGECERQKPNGGEERNEEDCESVNEARKTKQLCEIGGLSFMNCEDEGLFAKLVGEKTPKRVIDGGAGNKRKIDRKEPCSDSMETSDGDIPLAALIKTRTPKKIKAMIPGFGGVGKVEMVKKVRRRINVDFIGLVETKKDHIDRRLIFKLWGGGNGIKWEAMGCVSYLENLGDFWVWPNNTRECFDSWTSQSMTKNHLRRWTMSFFAVIWVVWGERNNRIFQESHQDAQATVNQIIRLVKNWEYDWQLRKNNTTAS
ncbi:hypothetical protein PIB30_043775 [Stylosanthes scabra]|uniref:Uncharacterized protein n=1 Tax=Stylosanthes scabra TaxID=79078 RepID=A0ABU6QF13_9FABA|nr:hypothetical protein [Stylosanthes scabra]